MTDRTTDDLERGDEVAAQLNQVARDLHEAEGPQGTMDAIVHAAVGTIPGAEHAGIMAIVGKRDVRTVAMTDDVPRDADQVQYDTGQGPCLTALYQQKIVSAPDLAAESRWPLFAARTLELNVTSMLSFRLYVEGDDLGALNLYSSRAHAFDDESEHVGLLFAGHAATSLARAQEREHLVESMQTRDLIGQAKGILMERHKVTADQAFGLLVRASQQTNLKLRVLAERLTRTGELPPPARRKP